MLQTYWLKHVVKLTRCLLLPTLCVIDLKTKPCRDISEAIKLWDFLGYFSSSILCGKYTSGERSKECLDKYVQLGCNSTHANYLGSKPYHKHSQPCLVTRKATTIYMYVCMYGNPFKNFSKRDKTMGFILLWELWDLKYGMKIVVVNHRSAYSRLSWPTQSSRTS